MTPEDCAHLEALIDKHSIASVLWSLAAICDGKAEHVAVNWQDAALARQWTDVAQALAKVTVTAGRI
jgi:hypothetical protein